MRGIQTDHEQYECAVSPTVISILKNDLNTIFTNEKVLMFNVLTGAIDH